LESLLISASYSPRIHSSLIAHHASNQPRRFGSLPAREALDSPLVAESEADREARLDIIDMIPVLNRKLVGEAQTIRDMAWEVSVESSSCISNHTLRMS
jgi:hypothetical protein